MVAIVEPSRPTRRAHARQCVGSGSCARDKTPDPGTDRNQQYSITAPTDGGGAIVERYAYTAYGQVTFADASETVQNASASTNRYAYTGRERDEGLRLYHFRARLYDAVAGSFVSRDPTRYFDGPSVYRAYFAPQAVDPTGKWRIMPTRHPNGTLYWPWENMPPIYPACTSVPGGDYFDGCGKNIWTEGHVYLIDYFRFRADFGCEDGKAVCNGTDEEIVNMAGRPGTNTRGHGHEYIIKVKPRVESEAFSCEYNCEWTGGIGQKLTATFAVRIILRRWTELGVPFSPSFNFRDEEICTQEFATSFTCCPKPVRSCPFDPDGNLIAASGLPGAPTISLMH